MKSLKIITISLILITASIWAMSRPSDLVENTLQSLTTVQFHLLMVSTSSATLTEDKQALRRLIGVTQHTAAPINLVIFPDLPVPSVVKTLHSHRLKVGVLLTEKYNATTTDPEIMLDSLVYQVNTQNLTSILSCLETTKLTLAQQKQTTQLGCFISSNTFADAPEAAYQIFNYVNFIILDKQPSDNLLPAILKYSQELSTPVYFYFNMAQELKPSANEKQLTDRLAAYSRKYASSTYAGLCINNYSTLQQLYEIKETKGFFLRFQ